MTIALLCLLVSALRVQCAENQYPDQLIEPFVVNIKPSNALHPRRQIFHGDGAESASKYTRASGEERNFHEMACMDAYAGRESLTNDWCRRESYEPCPAEMLSGWISRHRRLRKKKSQSRRSSNLNLADELERDEQYLVCKPLGGIGNFIAGLLSCLAIALITDRRLLLAPPPKTSRDNISTYEKPVSSLFDFPFDMSLRILGVEDVPFLVDPATGAAFDTDVLQMADVRKDDFLCQNLTEKYRLPITVMPAHLWLGAITQNPFHAAWFDKYFGRNKFGVVPFVNILGSWFFRPKLEILDAVQSLANLIQSSIQGSVYGLQIRTGLAGDTYKDRPPLDSAPEFVRCAYAYTPLVNRSKSSAWIIASDNQEAKAKALMQIAYTEGPIVSASNEVALRESLLLPSHVFAANGVLGVPYGRISTIHMDSELVELGFAVIMFASGTKVVILARPPVMTSEAGMKAAVIEMWLLSIAFIVVVTENSTFWLPAVSFVHGDRQSAYIMTRGKRCYPLPTREPVSDAGYRARTASHSPCYDESLHLDPSMIWLPP